jgi:peroxiredoxin
MFLRKSKVSHLNKYLVLQGIAFLGICFLLGGCTTKVCCVLPEIPGEEIYVWESKFSNMTFPMPSLETDMDYLGFLELAQVNFILSQIEGDAVIMEVFTTYCPYCKTEAPKANEVYSLIERQNLGDKIKMVGVGMAATQRDVDKFRDQYNIPFPLFADSGNKIYKVIGRVATPYFLVLRRNEQGELEQVYAEAERMSAPQAFLDTVLERTKISQ